MKRIKKDINIKEATLKIIKDMDLPDSGFKYSTYEKPNGEVVRITKELMAEILTDIKNLKNL